MVARNFCRIKNGKCSIEELRIDWLDWRGRVSGGGQATRNDPIVVEEVQAGGRFSATNAIPEVLISYLTNSPRVSIMCLFLARTVSRAWRKGLERLGNLGTIKNIKEPPVEAEILNGPSLPRCNVRVCVLIRTFPLKVKWEGSQVVIMATATLC